jgi:hypothetical protein
MSVDTDPKYKGCIHTGLRLYLCSLYSPLSTASLFHGKVGQVEPVLQKLNPQHVLHTDRWETYALSFAIKRLDHAAQTVLFLST